MDSQAFLRELESLSLPASSFDHTAHLFAAWSYRCRYPAREAAARCARTLSRFAMANGDAAKYHHTLTLSILTLLYDRMAQDAALSRDWSAFLSACDDIRRDARNVVLEHYSADRLNDDTARKSFVEPDRKPLPALCPLH
ncbi:hypothetical protein [Paludibacterium paludis]|uniref:Uncharacterized protein n=1 Tax=Paludibacterium paludis TaxID=1225769 RepID=A0A918NZ15_9NEIS|nr:hypothetical protein [Paludibacterium paludis]GGY06899.1 hypothetical protein GCM10011289_06830 [Paludibacterium paludis]